MSELVKCPFCGKDIENDSYYCDQCGTELKICPKCHTFGKGKFCPKCSSRMVSASQGNVNRTDSPATTSGQAKSPAQEQPRVGQPATGGNAPAATITEQPAVAVQLSCKAAGIVVPLKNGAVIGRRNGDYVSMFGNQPYVSGTHARLENNGGTWSITDLGSTNGTCVNGKRLTPNVAAPIRVGDAVRIATLDFIVE